MQKKHFEKMGIDVSRLGYGCMRFPTKADGTIDREKSLQLIDYAYQHGVNYFDTAYRYHGGESERFVKEALSRYPRESYNLATKFPIGFMPEETEEAVYKIFEEQLEKTGAGYFDFYLVHGLNATKIQLMKDLKLLDKLEEFKAKGLIRHTVSYTHLDVYKRQQFLCSYASSLSKSAASFCCKALASASSLPVVV